MKRSIALHTAVLLCTALVWRGQPAAAGPPKPTTDEEIKQMISAAGEAKDYDNAALVYVLDEADVYVQDSGLATTESCQVIKILTDAGTRAQTTLRHEFDPATNRVTIKSVRAHRKSGTIEDVPVDSLLTQPAPQHAIYWGNRQHVLALPRLEIGDCLEIRISKIGFNIAYLDTAGASGAGGGQSGSAADSPPEETLTPPMPGHWYETTIFQGGYPIIKKRYSVHMPKDKPVQYEEYNGPLQSSFWYGEDAHVLSWWAKDVAVCRGEPYQTATDDNAPKLVMATTADWLAKSRWFFEVNEPQFEADDAIRAKVKELTDGLPDEESKIVACLHWVADEVRYFGTSRGPCEGFTLHTGIETFHDRGGVCKDKAGMLITMLRVLGHEVYPALTMAGSRVEKIPADQFNHTVTVMRNKDGTFRVLDPTWSPQSKELWSSWEAKQHLVYGTPEGQDLTQAPYFPPEHNALAWQATSRIDSAGLLTSQMVIDAKNSPCTSFRRTIARTRVPEQRAVFEQAVAVAPNARIDELEWTDPYDYSQDTQVRMQLSAENYAAGGDKLMLFRLPMMTRPLGSFIAPDLAYPLDASERKTDLRLRASRLVRIEESIKLPPGFKVEHLPEAKKMDSPSAAFTFEAQAEGDTLTYKLALTIRDNVIPAKNYPGYKKAIEAMNEVADDWIICRAEAASTKDTSGKKAAADEKEVGHD